MLCFMQQQNNKSLEKSKITYYRYFYTLFKPYAR